MASSEITLEAVSSVSQIAAADWDACANPSVRLRSPQWPRHAGFIRRPRRLLHQFKIHAITHSFHMHFFLHWKPPARPARGPAGGRGICWPGSTANIAGIVPCYLKSHSQGEYVFDRGWADAYERAGGRYYPKLQASVPFTPGRRTAPVDPRRRRCRPHRHRAGERTGGAVRCHQGLIGARDLCARSRMEVSRRTRIPAAQRPAVSLAQSGLWQFRGFSRHPQFASPQGDQARTARGAGQRHHDPRADRQRHHRRCLGRLLRFLHGHRLAEMGPALPHPRILLADRRRAWPRTCCW